MDFEKDPVGAVGGFIDMLKPDFTKLNKPMAKSAISSGIDSLKGTTTWVADIDDMMWDQLKNICVGLVDKIGVQDVAPPGPVTVGAEPEMTAGDVDAFLSTFDGVNDQVREKLRKHPGRLKLVKENFTLDEQKKLVGNPFLIGLLTILGPVIIEWIKKLLSK